MNALPDPAAQAACKTLIHNCGNARTGETVAIVSEALTCDIGEALKMTAEAAGCRVYHEVISPLTLHGQEPPQRAVQKMAQADLILAVTRMSIVHTQARLRATRRGCRFLSLPDYSLAVLTGEALRTDFRALQPVARKLGTALNQGSRLFLSSPSGTQLSCSIAERRANCAPGWCFAPGTIASPPDAEVNIAPLEDSAEGVLVVDGSIPCPEIGLLKRPVTLSIRAGKVVDIAGPHAAALNRIFDSVGTETARVVAEFGIGLNPAARLCGAMLEDEGCLGTVHLGIGSNATIGGCNNVPLHLDFVLRSPAITIDGRWIDPAGDVSALMNTERTSR